MATEPQPRNRVPVKSVTKMCNSMLMTIYDLSKSRDITLPTKVRLAKAMVFPVVMYGCESWTIKKAECQRIDAFELWCWRRLLRVPWTARRSNQSILKGDQSWVFFGRKDAKAETPVLWPPHVESWLIGYEFEQAPEVGDGQGGLACCSPWGCRVGHDWATELNWADIYSLKSTDIEDDITPDISGESGGLKESSWVQNCLETIWILQQSLL